MDMADPATLRLGPDGAERLEGAALSVLDQLGQLFAGLPRDRAGIRLHGLAGLRALLMPESTLGALAAARLGPSSRPVRVLLFDKTEATNWSLPWHQDRTVCVRERRDVAGFTNWNRKAGLLHVAPPLDVLAGMMTMRVHLDPVPASNAPLLVAPGSHRLGVVREADIPGVVARCGTAACLAEAGDVWLYATPILHASAVADPPARRRVLQVDFAAGELPGGLEWLGV